MGKRIFGDSEFENADSFIFVNGKKITKIEWCSQNWRTAYSECGEKIRVNTCGVAHNQVLGWYVVKKGEHPEVFFAEIASRIQDLEDKAEERAAIKSADRIIALLKALEQQASAPKPEPAPAPTRPLQVGDRVRNAAGTDTGVVEEIYLDGDATINWDSGYGGHTDYNPVSLQHYRSPSHPAYGHVVLLESPDFDTQAREAGYVKAEEVAREFESRYPRSLAPNSWAALFVAWLHAQAKGGAK